IDSDDHGKRGPLLHVLRLRVERLAELHDVEAALAERRADRRRRVGRPGRHLQLEVSGNLLCHVVLLLAPVWPALSGSWCGSLGGWRPPSPPTLHFAPDGAKRNRERSKAPHSASLHAGYSHIFSTCPNSSSTGVARPKIDTATLTRERPSSTSSTTPLNEANGPSDTRTCSPTSNETAGFGRSMPSCTWCRIRSASASEIGIGFFSVPRNPVTFGVFLMR